MKKARHKTNSDAYDAVVGGGAGGLSAALMLGWASLLHGASL